MVVTKQMNIKNRTYYFYNDLKLDKKTSMTLSIYYIGYVRKKSEYKINSVNLFI